MPSFDIISEFDTHEVKNAIDQANKEVSTRFDFKGSNSTFELTDDKLIMISESTFQLQQMFSVVCSKLSRRGVDVACMEVGDAKGRRQNDAAGNYAETRAGFCCWQKKSLS